MNLDLFDLEDDHGDLALRLRDFDDEAAGVGLELSARSVFDLRYVSIPHFEFNFYFSQIPIILHFWI